MLLVDIIKEVLRFFSQVSLSKPNKISSQEKVSAKFSKKKTKKKLREINLAADDKPAVEKTAAPIAVQQEE